MIAEKLEAIVTLGRINSRMKDFYDLLMISRQFELDGEVLVAAIKATFARRQTDIPAGIPDGLSEAFATTPSARALWDAFLKRERLSLDSVDFRTLVAELRDFVTPLLKASIK